MKNLVGIGIVVAAILAAPAAAQGPNPPKRQPVSLADQQARAQAHFAKRDANGDGFLTLAEIQARHGDHPNKGQHAAKRFQRLDADNDGRISKAELTAHMAARFRRADANGDGSIGSDERRAGRGRGQGQRKN